MDSTAPQQFPAKRARPLVPVGAVTAWMLLVGYFVLMLPTQWVRAVLPYYGDVIFGTLMLVVAIPYLILRQFWRGTSKWAIIAAFYGIIVTLLTITGEDSWAFGWREFILDLFLFISVALGMKLGEASYVSLQSLVRRISWCCILMGSANILLMWLNIVQIDADLANRVVSVSLFYTISPLVFLIPLQVVFRLGSLLPTLSVAMVGLVAYFTLTRSIALTFFLLFSQLLLLWIRKLMGSFITAFTVWLFVVLPVLGGGTYLMLDSISESRGIDSITNTSGRDIEFEEFLEQMSNRGWALGNGLGTGFMMNGYDPETGSAVKVIATGLHYSTLTPVLKLGGVITILTWLAVLYGVSRVVLLKTEVEFKAVILVPLNYAIIYSISGGWMSSVYIVLGLCIHLIANFSIFVETAPQLTPTSPDGRPVLQRRHR